MTHNFSKQHLYDVSPHWLKAIFLNLYSARLRKERYGADFKLFTTLLQNTQWLNKEQIFQFQSEKLSEQIRHCYNTVPYYNDLFRNYKLKPKDIRNISDLSKIPVLTKELIRENFSKLLSTEKSPTNKNAIFGGTSGTTGTPLKVAWDQRMRAFNNAVDWRQKQWAGIEPGDRIALLLGRAIVSLNRTRPPFWQFDFPQNFLWMSAFHMNRDNLASYIEKLKKFNPKAIEGYPSTLYELAKYMVNSGEIFNLTAVFSSSEPLYENHRDTIELAFGCKVFDFYGLAERTIFATQCEAHEGHHLNFEYGITELVDQYDLPVSDEGQLVTTSLQNRAMPLLRYKVSDTTSFLTQPCICGREMTRISGIDTKQEDLIYKIDGTPISPSILTHPFKQITSINKSQIEQTDKTSIEIRIVKSSDYSKKDELHLLDAFQARIGNEMKITLQYVSDIPRESSGKFRWVINSYTRGGNFK